MQPVSQPLSDLPQVICIMGPTASGKTSLAIELAKQINGEIISVDSALVYLDMDIGTAKPDQEERQGIPHHLIDLLSPENTYSVANFLHDAQRSIDDIIKKGKMPIMAGGTMMYFNAMINGINQLPSADQEVRDKIQKDIEQHGLANAHETLKQVDPVSADKIHPNDPQRITRALEVYWQSKIPLSEWQSREKQRLPFDFKNFFIMPQERKLLHDNIALRFDQMLNNGFLGEVEALRDKYQLHLDLPALRSVGYRQVWLHLHGEYNFEEMRERGIIATRQLAKRQITWLNSFNEVNHLVSGSEYNITKLLKNLRAS